MKQKLRKTTVEEETVENTPLELRPRSKSLGDLAKAQQKEKEKEKDKGKKRGIMSVFFGKVAFILVSYKIINGKLNMYN